MAYRGSRKHVLDWTERSTFLLELVELLKPCPIRVAEDTIFMPRGYSSPNEARLESFGPDWLPQGVAWSELQKWWLKHPAGATTPNWDIAVGCTIGGKPGLVLVEAKANWSESKIDGKDLPQSASDRSRENHEHIGRAIAEANAGWQRIDARVAITRDSHYQLANRLAFAWKLATVGVSVALVYLGFTGDRGIWDAGKPFKSTENWRRAFSEHCRNVVHLELFERQHTIGLSQVWLLVRDRPVLKSSPPK